MGNPLWKVGVSGNPTGRKKGAKRSIRTTIARFILRNGSLKELQANYDLLKPGKERLDFLLKLIPYDLAPVSQNELSQQELDRLYDMVKTKANESIQKTG